VQYGNVNSINGYFQENARGRLHTKSVERGSCYAYIQERQKETAKQLQASQLDINSMQDDGAID